VTLINDELKRLFPLIDLLQYKIPAVSDLSYGNEFGCSWSKHIGNIGNKGNFCKKYVVKKNVKP
jgi:hypothetical protein